jgi:hypothetical protein
LWLVLHVLAVVAVPVADGFADHGAVAAAHFEDAGRGDCPAEHGAAHCDLCQLLHADRAVTRGDVELAKAPDVTADGRLTAAALLGPRATARGGSSPRAPPAIS